ncbi:MAG: YbaB/EbfC family nucleoid-associated protein [Paracoccaceae bacterium]|jgi:DNA-binding YbaB/EbfC family protein
MLKGLGNLGGLGDITKMMKAAQDMQQKMSDLTEELHRINVVGESGAGLVTATVTAKGELKALSIDPSIFKADDKEVVEDLILAAIKDAQSKAEARSKEEMGKLTASMGLPADMKLPF